MSWFNQGYDHVEKRDREIKDAMRTFLPSLIVKDTDEDAYISFVTSNPITYYEHFVKSLKKSFTCPDNGDSSKGTCPLCAMGNKPSFRGAYLVIDHRHETWEDRQTKEQKSQQHTLKIAKWGIRVLKQLQKLDNKLKKGSPVQPAIPDGILGVPFEVMRSGTGTDTSYTFNALQPNEEHFPRTYQLPEKDGMPVASEQDAIVDAIKPLSREKLLEAIGGGTPNQSQQPPQQFGQPLNLGSDDEDVIDFGN